MIFLKKTTEFLKNIAIYNELLIERKITVFLVIASNIIASFCEGMALVVLIPLIQISTGDNSSEVSIIVTYLLNFMAILNLELNIPSIVAIFLFFSFFSAVANYISSYLTAKFRTNVETSLKQKLFDALLNSQWIYFARNKTGSLAKSLLQDTTQASTGFMYLLFSISYLVTFLVLLIFAFILSSQMTVLTIFFALILMPLYLIILKSGQKSGQKASNFANKLSSEATEMLINAKLLFCQGLRKTAKSRFQIINDAWYQENIRQAKQSSVIRFLFEFTSSLFIALFLMIVVWHQEQPIALALVFLMVFYRLAPRLSQFQSCFYLATINSSWLQNWKQIIIQAENNVQPICGKDAPTLLRDIKFKNVTFGYPNSEQPTLSNVSFNIPACSSFAIIGGSGQGKSTSLDLVTGLINPQEGIVEIDGKDLRKINLNAWQSHIGMVLQENPIINASIAENIVFGSGEVDMQNLKEAATLAGAIEFIEEMPEGFNTIAGERGSRLSGGQKQRIALARALYRKPWLLLLDEVTSALDGISTEALIASLKKLKSRMTIILVTHDHRLLEMADQTIEVFNGLITNK